jgi:hypothetical protein
LDLEAAVVGVAAGAAGAVGAQDANIIEAIRTNTNGIKNFERIEISSPEIRILDHQMIRN